MAVVYLLDFLAVCHAQAPIPCESPKQWEGDWLLVDSSKRFSERARIHYDEVSKRIKTEDKIDEGREREYISGLCLFNTAVNRKCKNEEDCVLGPIGVPSGSRLPFEAELGAAQIPNEHLSIATFFGSATEDHMRYSTVVTIPGCIPIGDNYYNDTLVTWRAEYAPYKKKNFAFHNTSAVSSTSRYEIPWVSQDGFVERNFGIIEVHQ